MAFCEALLTSMSTLALNQSAPCVCMHKCMCVCVCVCVCVSVCVDYVCACECVCWMCTHSYVFVCATSRLQMAHLSHASIPYRLFLLNANTQTSGSDLTHYIISMASPITHLKLLFSHRLITLRHVQSCPLLHSNTVCAY